MGWGEISLLWSEACNHIQDLYVHNIGTISSPNQLLLVKEELLLMAETVTDDFFGLKPVALFETMRSLWKRFEALQVEFVCAQWTQLLASTPLQPLHATSYEIFQSQVRSFQLDMINFDEYDLASPTTVSGGATVAPFLSSSGSIQVHDAHHYDYWLTIDPIAFLHTIRTACDGVRKQVSSFHLLILFYFTSLMNSCFCALTESTL